MRISTDKQDVDNQRLDIMEILSVSTQKGIKVYAAKGDWALDGSLQSKVVAMCFAMAAEIERMKSAGVLKLTTT